MMIASMDAFLGTVWWSALMIVIGFGAGLYLRPCVAKFFSTGDRKSNCKCDGQGKK